MKLYLASKELDLKELQEKIIYFRILKNKYPYLFMSGSTLSAIEDQSDLKSFNEPVNSVICEYRGCKVYLDNSLWFGEVELR
jgi:hypothetical protein